MKVEDAIQVTLALRTCQPQDLYPAAKLFKIAVGGHQNGLPGYSQCRCQRIEVRNFVTRFNLTCLERLRSIDWNQFKREARKISQHTPRRFFSPLLSRVIKDLSPIHNRHQQWVDSLDCAH